MSVPARIGRYRVLELLGTGGFAAVWRGHDPDLEVDVAIKVLAEHWLPRLDVTERFVNEARILRRADADRLVRVHDVGTLPDGRPYFVMTHADLGTLQDRLDSQPLPSVPEAVRISVEVARGVSVLHDLGVLHRDIKPSNVLFRSTTGGPRVMVADLGIAKALAEASGLTVGAGTAGYAAPEQATMGGGLDVRADVYALGALTYHLLTGERPAVGDAVAPSTVRVGVPAHVDSVVSRALAVDRDLRPDDVSRFLDELLHPPDAPPPVQAAPATVAGSETRHPASQSDARSRRRTTPPAETPSGPRRWLSRRVGAAVAVVALLVAMILVGHFIVTYRANRDGSPPDARHAVLRAKHGQITARLPIPYEFSGEVTEEKVSLREYGGTGTGYRTYATYGPNGRPTGSLTIVAGRTFPRADTPTNAWLPLTCPGQGVDETATNPHFRGGTVRTWASAACGNGHTYAMAVLRGDGYAVHAYMTGRSETPPSALTGTLNSVTVDKDAAS